MNFTVRVAHRTKLKESEKLMRYLDFAKELEQWWSKKVTVIPMIFETVGTFQRTWKKEWESWRYVEGLKPSKPQHYWDRQEYWEESWRNRETCCHLDTSKNHLLVMLRKLINSDMIMITTTTISSKKEKLPNSRLCRSGRPQSENKKKRKER